MEESHRTLLWGEGVRITDSAVVSAYKRLGSVWRVGSELGVAGQTVSRRLRRAGVLVNRRYWTEPELNKLRDYYKTTPVSKFSLDQISSELGRDKYTVCGMAGRVGITNQSRKSSAVAVESMKKASAGQWDDRPHPRGMLGKKHTPETLLAVSAASKRAWSTWKTFGIGPASPEAIEKSLARLRAGLAVAKPENAYSRCKSGRRDDLGDTFFRSSWEANYARYLNLLLKMGAVKQWEYEPERFWFDGIRAGVTSYTPDFRVLYSGAAAPEYIEIKGFTTPKDRTKWRRLKKYHPDKKLVVVAAKEYYALARKWSSAIPNWESGKGGGRKTGPRKRKAAANRIVELS